MLFCVPGYCECHVHFCSFFIVNPVHMSNWQVIAFQALYFDVYYSAGCVSDWLRYYNGALLRDHAEDMSTPQAVDFCGYSVPMFPISGSDVVTFQFQSPTSIYSLSKGVYILYDAVRIGVTESVSQKAFGKYSDR